jgi:hypothetical protein
MKSKILSVVSALSILITSIKFIPKIFKYSLEFFKINKQKRIYKEAEKVLKDKDVKKINDILKS